MPRRLLFVSSHKIPGKKRTKCKKREQTNSAWCADNPRNKEKGAMCWSVFFFSTRAHQREKQMSFFNLKLACFCPVRQYRARGSSRFFFSLQDCREGALRGLAGSSGLLLSFPSFFSRGTLFFELVIPFFCLSLVSLSCLFWFPVDRSIAARRWFDAPNWAPFQSCTQRDCALTAGACQKGQSCQKGRPQMSVYVAHAHDHQRF